VHFGNNDFGGAEVKVVWPRSALNSDAHKE
jgi:hypothetical protein